MPIQEIEKEFDQFAADPKYKKYDLKYKINRFMNKNPQYKPHLIELYILKTGG